MDRLPTVPFTGTKTLQELNFRQRYRIAEFDCRHYTYNRKGRLEKLCIYLEWVRSRSSNRNGVCTDVPLELEAMALNFKGFSKKDAERFRRWSNENKFIVCANGGDYVPHDKAKTYYVNHTRINAFFSLLREKGLLPKGSKWKLNAESKKVQERAVAKSERVAGTVLSESEWLESVRGVRMFTDLHIPLVRKYGISPEERGAIVLFFAKQNTPIYTATNDTCTAFNQLICSKSCVTHTLQSTLTHQDPPSPPGTTAAPPPPHKVTPSLNENEPNLANLERNRQFQQKISARFSQTLLQELVCHPKLRVSSNAVVRRVSYRVYSGAALLKSHDTRDHGKWETSERKQVLDTLYGVGGYERIDRHASIHHLTLCLNEGRYFHNGAMDIYGSIHRDAFGYDLCDKGGFKKLVNRIYFTPSERLYACQVMRAEGSHDDARRAELMDEHRSLTEAYEGRCGKPLGAEIFAYESLLMALVQYRLLERYGLRSCNIYDELVVEKCGKTRKELVELVEDISRDVFPVLLRHFGGDDCNVSKK